jgi:hypothetical protein
MQQLKPGQKMLEVIWDQGPGENVLEPMVRPMLHATSETRNQYWQVNVLDEYNKLISYYLNWFVYSISGYCDKIINTEERI